MVLELSPKLRRSNNVLMDGIVYLKKMNSGGDINLEKYDINLEQIDGVTQIDHKNLVRKSFTRNKRVVSIP